MLFQKTRLRLVTLNVIVVFVLLNALGTAVYFTMKVRLYSEVDRALQAAEQRLFREPFPRLHSADGPAFPAFLPQERKRFAELDRRYMLLVWDQQGNFVSTGLGEQMDEDDYSAFRKEIVETATTETIKVKNASYRVHTIPAAKRIVVDDRVRTSAQIQLVYNLAPEDNMLNSLLYVVVIGSAVSLLIAFVAGRFLAQKALIPIQVSWEKQQQFIADASHELRTPLTAIMVNLERLFRHPDRTIEQESEKIVIGLQEAKRLNKLVSDLLTLARSDSNELQIFRQRFRLDEVVQRCAHVFSELAVAREIRLQTDIHQPLEMVGDEERIHQLLVILLDNALKYTQPHGTIHVACRREGQKVSVEVRDTGIGIPKEDIPFIFDRFYRVDKMRSKSTDGTGLGLSIARWIVDAHQGKIHVTSEEGTGTVVYVTLPLK